MLSMNTAKTMRPRAQSSRPAVEVQPRDEEIILHVGEHRFLRSSQIKHLVGFPSDRMCQARLKKLREAGYLQLITPPHGEYREGGGSTPRIYALGNRGAQLVAERHDIWMSSRFTENNNSIKPMSLAHDLELAEFMVALELQCRAHPHAELIPFQHILARSSKETRQSKKPRQWRIKVQWGTDAHSPILTPDKIFGLRDQNRPRGQNSAFFFLEYDRGSETITPQKLSFTRSSVARKLVEYGATFQRFRDEGVMGRYGLPNFRVLFLTNSPKRVENLIAAHQTLTRPKPMSVPSSVFLFSDFGTCDRHVHDILAMPWHDGAGRQLTLLC